MLDAIRQIQHELDGRVPLIGFAGAPFTLASYAIEGGHSNNFAQTKALMYGDPAAWHRLCERLADIDRATICWRRSRRASMPCRCSTRGSARSTRRDYREFVLPHTRRIFDALAPSGCPDDSFRRRHRRDSRASMREAGGDVIGVDWRTPLDEAWHRIGPDRAIQGNLDPTLLLGPLDRMLAGGGRRAGARGRHARATSSTSVTASCPSTPVEHVQALAHDTSIAEPGNNRA